MDTDSILRLMQDVAAEVINPRFRSLSHGEVHEKAPGDLVTDADHEAEVLITEALNAAYPNAVVLGEEAFAQDESLMDRYRAATHAFTVDPVDGTKNFVNGSPDHAVMVAEIRDGVAVRGWIWQPQHEVAYVAEAGAGATRNGEPLTTHRPAGAPPTWRGVTSRRSWLQREFDDLAPLELTWVCCGVDYPHLIAGDADFVLYARAWPWDHEPGGLILREAGGFLGPLRDGSLIAAADRTTYDAVLQRVRPHAV
ncbi:inositol monophosphatase [Nocardioides salsibiostraticola]